MNEKFCWLRLKRHDWVRTGGFRFGPAFGRGPVLRCGRCGHTIATVNRELLARAKEPT